ncbi:uncharacterized protein LOC136033257 [Artemia franciscana]|uniref:uncharacterized protein LOC136033257 n=1 Tax=Artemia franciscana TaxID=6661 RepID=UPI0032DAE75D
MFTGSIQLPTTGGALNSHNSGSMYSSVQPAVPSPKTKDQRSVAVSSNRCYVPHTFGQAQPRFPAPIQRPAVTQPGNGKPMKLSGNQVGVSSVETYSSQGTRAVNENQSAGSNQDLLSSGGANNGQTMRNNHPAMPTGDSTQTCNQSPSSMEVNEVN